MTKRKKGNEMLIDDYNQADLVFGPKTSMEIGLASYLKIVGFGRAMQIVQIKWGLYNENGNDLFCEPGSEFVIGPCRAEVVACGCDDPVDCEWCAGTGWLTKRVKIEKDGSTAEKTNRLLHENDRRIKEMKKRIQIEDNESDERLLEILRKPKKSRNDKDRK
jgi:hypothetical protein